MNLLLFALGILVGLIGPGAFTWALTLGEPGNGHQRVKLDDLLDLDTPLPAEKWPAEARTEKFDPITRVTPTRLHILDQYRAAGPSSASGPETKPAPRIPQQHPRGRGRHAALSIAHQNNAREHYR